MTTNGLVVKTIILFYHQNANGKSIFFLDHQTFGGQKQIISWQPNDLVVKNLPNLYNQTKFIEHNFNGVKNVYLLQNQMFMGDFIHTE